MMDNFTADDIEFIMDCLDTSLESERNSAWRDGLMGMMLASDKDAALKASGKLNDSLDTLKRRSKPKAERITLLKAKLIGIRDSLASKAAFAGTCEPTT